MEKSKDIKETRKDFRSKRGGLFLAKVMMAVTGAVIEELKGSGTV